MRVLHYISSTGMGRGEAYIDLVNELCESIDIILLIPKNAFYKDRIDKKVMVIEYKSYDSRISLLLLIEIFLKIKRENPDIVHTHFVKATQIFNLLNKLLHIPHVATKHNSRKGKIFNKLDNVIAVSKGVKETILNENVHVIYNGVKQVEVHSKSKNEIFTILAIGRLDKIKGFDILIKKCSRLHFPFRLEIVGEGEERKNLETLIHKLNLEGNVTLLGFKEDIPQQMKNADIVVMSSHSEGFSLVMVEALFYANMFISTRVSGAIEILDDRFLFDYANMVNKLNDIYLNQNSYKIEFLKLQKKIQDKFLLNNIAHEYIQYYQSTINREIKRG